MRPLYFDRELGLHENAEGRPPELTSESVRALIADAPSIQGELSSVPIEERLAVIEHMARTWKERLDDGHYDRLKKDMAASTGYSEALMDTELSFIPAVLSAENIRRNLNASCQGGEEALSSFVEVDETEHFRHYPIGPVLIISSGNSIVPTLIPTIVSLVTGNLTILKPSIANYKGVLEVFKLLNDVPESRAGKAIRKALVISYFGHDSEVLRSMLEDMPIGMVNFWGAEPARSIVADMVNKNRHYPRFFVNGPFTGMAIIEDGAATEDSADGLALDMVLYDQQLCSSPTSAVFVGGLKEARDFASTLGDHLDEIGGEFPVPVDQDRIFLLQGVRRFLQTNGSYVLGSKDPANPWTLVVSDGNARIGEMMDRFPSYNLFARKRFLEIVAVEDMDQAVAALRRTPHDPAFKGIDGVQSVGISVRKESLEGLSEALCGAGVHRILPLGDMFMRGAVEPYDGVTMASLFTRIVYWRKINLSPGEQI